MAGVVGAAAAESSSGAASRHAKKAHHGAGLEVERIGATEPFSLLVVLDPLEKLRVLERCSTFWRGERSSFRITKLVWPGFR